MMNCKKVIFFAVALLMLPAGNLVAEKKVAQTKAGVMATALRGCQKCEPAFAYAYTKIPADCVTTPVSDCIAAHPQLVIPVGENAQFVDATAATNSGIIAPYGGNGFTAFKVKKAGVYYITYSVRGFTHVPQYGDYDYTFDPLLFVVTKNNVAIAGSTFNTSYYYSAQQVVGIVVEYLEAGTEVRLQNIGITDITPVQTFDPIYNNIAFPSSAWAFAPPATAGGNFAQMYIERIA